jgi:hypothetical protein
MCPAISLGRKLQVTENHTPDHLRRLTEAQLAAIIGAVNATWSVQGRPSAIAGEMVVLLRDADRHAATRLANAAAALGAIGLAANIDAALVDEPKAGILADLKDGKRSE